MIWLGRSGTARTGLERNRGVWTGKVWLGKEWQVRWVLARIGGYGLDWFGRYGTDRVVRIGEAGRVWRGVERTDLERRVEAGLGRCGWVGTGRERFGRDRIGLAGTVWMECLGEVGNGGAWQVWMGKSGFGGERFVKVRKGLAGLDWCVKDRHGEVGIGTDW